MIRKRHASVEHVIVTAGDDGVMRFWNAATGDALASFVAFEDRTWAFISANGRYDCSDPDNDPGLHAVLGLHSVGQKLSNPPGFDRIQDRCRLFP